MTALEQGNVVKDYYIGDTRVKICDDYCRDCTPQEIDEILKRIARRAQIALSAAVDGIKKIVPDGRVD